MMPFCRMTPFSNITKDRTPSGLLQSQYALWLQLMASTTLFWKVSSMNTHGVLTSPLCFKTNKFPCRYHLLYHPKLLLSEHLKPMIVVLWVAQALECVIFHEVGALQNAMRHKDQHHAACRITTESHYVAWCANLDFRSKCRSPQGPTFTYKDSEWPPPCPAPSPQCPCLSQP